MAFATVTDLENRWRTLSESEKKQAQVLLDDASAFLTTLCRRYGVEILQNDEVQQTNLKAVTSSIVQRKLGVDEELFGVTQYSQTAGPFTSSGTAANPNGDMYITAQEKTLLGFPASGKRSQLFSVRGAIHTPEGGMVDDW